jgi:hydroxyethylthiazole kinase-like uncharacterized protein yjeF
VNDAQVLTAAQMRSAEEALFAQGLTPFALMERAATKAAGWVQRIAAGRPVTVLCGPGNNGGDGYVIARECRRAGLDVTVVAPLEPGTDQAREARASWLALEGAGVFSSGKAAAGGALVDCLFGSGLARPLVAEHALLLRDLARRHAPLIALDVPSGIASDSGEILADRLPPSDVTLALGAWKFAHCLAAARSCMGTLRLVPIGIGVQEGAVQRIERPQIAPPAATAHKYSRGLCAVIAGAMPGAALLSASAAMRGGAGYVKVLSQTALAQAPASLVVETDPLGDALSDKRIAAVLVGPGLGRDDGARARLACALRGKVPLVLDADALVLLGSDQLDRERSFRVIATPHDGELAKLCTSFAVVAEGRMDRARALAKASGMIVVAKGPDTFVACPEGRLAIGPPTTSWLSVAGTGDVLAGIIASRLATGADPFTAACEAVWLHGEAARRAGPAFTSEELACCVSAALTQAVAAPQ